jgi:hypothetical protein
MPKRTPLLGWVVVVGRLFHRLGGLRRAGLFSQHPRLCLCINTPSRPSIALIATCHLPHIHRRIRIPMARTYSLAMSSYFLGLAQ